METTSLALAAPKTPTRDLAGLTQAGVAGLTAPVELLCLRLDGQEYGLPLPLIQEIRCFQTATPLPGQDSAALGVMSFRGQVIALLDLRRLLGLSDARGKPAGPRAVIVLGHQGRQLGLVVDAVVDVLLAQPSESRSMPRLPGLGPERHIRGLVLTDSRQVLLLHPHAWITAYASSAA